MVVLASHPHLLHELFRAIVDSTAGPPQFQRKDLISCSLVCKTWASYALPILWRDSVHLRILNENSRRLRQLVAIDSDKQTERLIDLLLNPKGDFVERSLFDYTSFIRTVVIEIGFPGRQPQSSMLNLLRNTVAAVQILALHNNNSNVRSGVTTVKLVLHPQYPSEEFMDLFWTLIAAIPTLRYLRSVKIELREHLEPGTASKLIDTLCANEAPAFRISELKLLGSTEVHPVGESSVVPPREFERIVRTVISSGCEFLVVRGQAVETRPDMWWTPPKAPIIVRTDEELEQIPEFETSSLRRLWIEGVSLARGVFEVHVSPNDSARFLAGLKELRLVNTVFADDEMVSNTLAGTLRNVERLVVSAPRTRRAIPSGAGITRVRWPKIRKLDLSSTEFGASPPFFKALESCSVLESVLLRSVENLTDECVEALVDAIGKLSLRELDLSGCRKLTSRSGWAISTSAPLLVWISVQFTGILGDDDAVEILRAWAECSVFEDVRCDPDPRFLTYVNTDPGIISLDKVRKSLE
ncbi:hypothetical protein BJ742DRAFT_413200 [Cladochytrium replicatum]|nr:hypothetical protein BJ742DRAFT_413200 [Cladochytrium replicatum]